MTAAVFVVARGLLFQRLARTILHTTDGILDLAGGTLCGAFALQFRVAGQLADTFLDRSANLPGDPRYSSCDASMNGKRAIWFRTRPILPFVTVTRPALPLGRPKMAR
jgi:hypothetical protein